MTLYLDASVIVPLLLDEPTSKTIIPWLERQTTTFHVSQLAIGESASAISRRRRMKQLSAEHGELALSKLDEWVRADVSIVEHESADIADATRLVRRPVPKLLMPDAVHLATCRRLGLCMVTADVELIKVADLLAIDWVMPA